MTNILFTTYAPTTTGTLTFGAAIASQVPVAAKTASYVVLTADSATNFTNVGASSQITFTLPAVVSGMEYTFYVENSNGLIVDAAGANTIRIANALSSAGGQVTSSTVGSSITLLGISSSEWAATSLVGSWTAS